MSIDLSFGGKTIIRFSLIYSTLTRFPVWWRVVVCSLVCLVFVEVMYMLVDECEAGKSGATHLFHLAPERSPRNYYSIFFYLFHINAVPRVMACGGLFP